MKTNTPLADALMSRIRDLYPSESEERHRKRCSSRPLARWQLLSDGGSLLSSLSCILFQLPHRAMAQLRPVWYVQRRALAAPRIRSCQRS